LNLDSSPESKAKLAYATAKLGYSAYTSYVANENTRAIADENAHLKKYINAKNRSNEALAQTPQLKQALALQEEDSITRNTDRQLAKIYEDNPALKKIFQTDKQEFKTEKDKIIFIQTLKELVKTNDGLKGEYKIWQKGEEKISDKKLKIAKMHFTRHYKSQFKKYQNDRFIQPGNAEIMAAYKEAVKADFMGSVVDAVKLYRNEKGAADGLTSTVTSLATATAGAAFVEENKKMKALAENATLRMDVPEYEIGSEGTYKHELARIAFAKQAEAMTLEIMTQKGVAGTDAEIRREYKKTKAEVEKKLKEKDPLFSESNLNQPNMTTRAYNFVAGIANSANPLGNKPSLPTTEQKTPPPPDKPAAEKTDAHETVVTATIIGSKLPLAEVKTAPVITATPASTTARTKRTGAVTPTAIPIEQAVKKDFKALIPDDLVEEIHSFIPQNAARADSPTTKKTTSIAKPIPRKLPTH
jgi:hypothetical protein